MAKMPPQYIFVVRHGNRLDAADKKWHLSSPTPYDPPLTYGGFLQARQVGSQIASLLEQAKIDDEASAAVRKRKRFNVVIHSSPFLRCVQTSIGISAGLAQTPLSDSVHDPSDLIVPQSTTCQNTLHFKSTLLRLDSFLGEWLSPEYFEMITPPPGPALMMGGAKADLLRREDYSAYDESLPTTKPVFSSNSLWQGSSSFSPAAGIPSPKADDDSTISLAALAPALATCTEQPRDYILPRPLYAVSSSGKIPEGLVAHARDACVTVDFQWDSSRQPLDFGDGGTFGEEWAAMHQRFRGGLRKLVNWYATTDSPADLVVKPAGNEASDSPQVIKGGEEVDTVLVIVSHGAGCNALIGAITHQPVLMDVGIASITMASRKPCLDYAQMLAAATISIDPSAKPVVQVDKMYDLRLSASTEHLHSTSSMPASSRSASVANMRNPAVQGARGRKWTLGGSGGLFISPDAYHEALLPSVSRSSSASAAVGTSAQRDSAGPRPALRGPAPATAGLAGAIDALLDGHKMPSVGLWAPAQSSLRLMDDGGEGADDFGSMMPNFNLKKPEPANAAKTKDEEEDEEEGEKGRQPPRREGGDSSPKPPPTGPMLAAPIRIHTSVGSHPTGRQIEEVKMAYFGGGLGGLWGVPPPPDDAERYRDLSQTKRRWTVNEHS